MPEIEAQSVTRAIRFPRSGVSEQFQEKFEMSLKDEKLARYGWNDYFAAHFREYAEQGFSACRVALEYNQFYRVYTAEGEILAETAGRLRHEAGSRADLPAVGDWVALRAVEGEKKAVIHALL